MSKNLSIVIPVYNERESLSLMVKILNSTLSFNNEIIIVYDNEEDNSIPIAKKLATQFSNILLVHNTLGKGVKYALKAGIDKSKYDIIYNKIFVLEIVGKDEFVITYNVDQTNLNSIPDNTILVHRKKESNTLYTINALNELIKKLNGGVVDTSYKVDWQHYRNCILLTQHNELNQLNTKIYKIIEL